MSTTQFLDATDENCEREIEIFWIESVFVIAALALTFQIWPTFYFKSADLIYDSLDLTRWGWQSHLAANVTALTALAVIRIRQDLL